MSVELIGLMFAAIAGAAFLHSSRATFAVLAIAALFQASAALFIGAGGQITPGHMVLGFFAGAIVLRQRGLAYAASSTVFPRAGFWLMMMTLWSVFSALALPRLFQGQFEVVPLGIANIYGVIAPIPLQPVSSNLNQSVYFIGNLLAFMGVVGMCRSHSMLRAAAIGVLVAVTVNLVIVVLDLATFAIGQTNALSFMRNADYSQLYHAKAFGMKRITGSFPEASSYATAAMGLMAFSLRLWRGGVMTRFSGPLAAVTLLTVVMSTSTTAYVALAAYFVVVYSFAIVGVDPALSEGHVARAPRGKFLMMGPLAAFGVVVIMAVRPDLFSVITDFLNEMVGEKLMSDSGQERSSWNMAAMQTTLDTLGLGAGLGSVRASSFLVGVPANIGLIGSFFFGMFFLSLFRPGNARLETKDDYESRQIAAAARSACFAILIAASAAAGTIDLGLLFFAFAGLACASVFQKKSSVFRVGPAPEIPEDLTEAPGAALESPPQ